MLAVLVVLALASAAYKENVIWAINCGSSDGFEDGYGIEFTKDKFYIGGKDSDFGEQFEEAWDKTPDWKVQLTERYSTDDLVYQIPLESGHYVIDLKFSEVYFDEPNKKVFNIMLGSSIVMKDVDIYARIGKLKPLDEFIEIEITENKEVKHQNKILKEAYYQGKLILKFAKGTADNPKVNGIVIFKGKLENTYYQEKKAYMEKLKTVEKEKKKKVYTKILNDEVKSNKLEQLGPKGVVEGVSFYNEVYESTIRNSLEGFLQINGAIEMACYGMTVLIFILVVVSWKN
jgi:hypothetical protein